jgi:hypothetical protein
LTGGRGGAVGAPVDDRIRAAERAFVASRTVEAELALRVEQRRAGAHLAVPARPLVLRFPTGDGDESDLRWFLRKASFGSYKAPWILEQTQDALVERRARDEAGSEITYRETLRRALPPFPPFPTPQPWLDQALTAGVLETPVSARPTVRHPAGRYDPQWEREVVSFEDLLHDATLLCWERWSAVEWVELSETVLRDHDRYSSCHAVAALLFTLAAWSWCYGDAL